MDISEQINKLEEKAINFKNAKKYLESLKKYEEVIQLKKETFGERNESTIRSSSEAAIVCNILSMSFLQKGKLEFSNKFRKLCCRARTSEKSRDLYR